MADRKRLAELGTATPLAKELAEQIEAGGAADVTSVNGATGDVILDASDVGAVAPGDLAPVATSGAYADVTGTPSLAFSALPGTVADAAGGDLQAILEDLASRIAALEP